MHKHCVSSHEGSCGVFLRLCLGAGWIFQECQMEFAFAEGSILATNGVIKEKNARGGCMGMG